MFDECAGNFTHKRLKALAWLVAVVAFFAIARALYIRELNGLPQAPVKTPNIVFILTDDLGWGDTGFNWQNSRAADLPRLHTPNLDRFAAEGVVMSDHYCAAPVCAPSRASILTGKLQGECSLKGDCFDRPFAETKTLGTVLKDAGYATWAVGKWGVAGGGESRLPVTSHPLDRGFDYFYGFLDHCAGHTYYHHDHLLENGAWMGVTENRTNAVESARGVYSTDLYTAKAIDLIRRHVESGTRRPFFLYFAVNTIHASHYCADRLDPEVKCREFLHVPAEGYTPGKLVWPMAKEDPAKSNTYIHPDYAALTNSAAARYATAIRRFDDDFGEFLGELQRLGIDRDTLVVFTSDNGAAAECGGDPRHFASTGPFRGKKRDVLEGGMRVPAVMRWPGTLAPGTDSAPSISVDWMPTFEAVAKGGKIDGIVRRSPVRCEYNGQSMRREGDRVYLRLTPDSPEEIYDVVKDPGEIENLAK